jgi:diacylglycerol kinase (ATP)
MKPAKTGIARLIDATRYSFAGLRACYVNEAAFRQEIVAVAILLMLSFVFARTPVQWLMLVAPLFLLLIVELLNSAIESVVDRVGSEKHELSGRAKDMGSAAVFVCLLLIACCWGTVIWTNYL